MNYAVNFNWSQSYCGFERLLISLSAGIKWCPQSERGTPRMAPQWADKICWLVEIIALERRTRDPPLGGVREIKNTAICGHFMATKELRHVL